MYRPIQLPQASLSVQPRSQNLTIYLAVGRHALNENGEKLKIVKNLHFLFTAFVIAVRQYHGSSGRGERMVDAGKDTRWA